MHNLWAPLNNLLKKDLKWHWTDKCQKAFKKIKEIFEIVVASDVSNYGIGAVILHKHKDGTTKAVAHASRSLLLSETKYSQIKMESLAIIYTFKKFHKYIHGRSFT